ncbi:LysE family transporter [Streptomyces griseoaurantiacus]|uniref:LysE family transporter n=1 Tax=Streptomyces griseoaurantiacus TaxID=68213 RepID=UPI00362A3C79
MSAALVAGLLAGYGIAMPVGAVATWLVGLTARTSPRVGVFAALGVATADGLYALVSVVGGASLAPLIAPIATPLRWVSAAVLLVLACRGAAAALAGYREGLTGGGSQREPATSGRAYVGFLGVTLLNPVTVVYFTALVLAAPGGAVSRGCEKAGFVLAAFVASASWQLLLVGGGALLGRALTGPRGRLCTALVSSAVVLGLAVRSVLPAP